MLPIIAALILSCASSGPEPRQFRIPEDIDRVLVVDFRDMNEGNSDRISVRCPLSGRVFVAGPVSPEAPEILSEHLRRLLSGDREFKFISARTLWDIQSGLLEGGREISERILLTETGKSLGADAVIAGHIYRYEDLVGGGYSAEMPASVAFDVHLVRVSDGRVLWSGQFDETQKALTDDLFQADLFFKRKGKWVTAAQMAKEGLERIMEAFEQK
jgi:hypothetical protein